jgi:serine/threonine protein phosphatase 1
MMTNPILYLEKNDIGHDFIVGDIHGRLSALQKLLDKVCFDTDRDRLFCVGDMIDCGEDSMGVLKLAKNSPWFYTTIGNHEDMLLSYLNHRISLYHGTGDFIANGGYWINEHKDRLVHILDEYVPWILNLPYVIHVDSNNPGASYKASQGFCVIHAGSAGSSWENLHDPCWVWDNRDLLTWDRNIGQQGLLLEEVGLPPNCTPIYCGHTPVRQPMVTMSNVITPSEDSVPMCNINLDCGAKLDAENLVMVEHPVGRVIRLKEKGCGWIPT